MQNRNQREHSPIKTPRKGLFAWLRLLWNSSAHPPTLQVRLKGEPNILYPRMSRGEIRHVAAAICQAAIRNAK